MNDAHDGPQGSHPVTRAEGPTRRDFRVFGQPLIEEDVITAVTRMVRRVRR